MPPCKQGSGQMTIQSEILKNPSTLYRRLSGREVRELDLGLPGLMLLSYLLHCVNYVSMHGQAVF